MKHKRYARPRFITADDKRYREHVAHFVLQRRNHRAIQPPCQRSIFGVQAEAALRDWLSSHFTLSERRILEYEEQHSGRATIKYRELDAVAIEDQRNIWIFEMKASRMASSLRRAIHQLQETRAILHVHYPNVHCMVLLVDTGIPTTEEVSTLMSNPEAPEVAPPTLPEMLAVLPGVLQIMTLDERCHDGITVNLVRFSVEDIIALVGADQLALDWEADDEPEESAASATDNALVYSTPDDEDEVPDVNSSLAAALRRAGLQ